MQIEHLLQFVKARHRRPVILSLMQNLCLCGRPPPIIFALIHINECPTTLSLTVFTQRNFVADFLQAKCDFRRKLAVLRFEPPLGGLGATYDDHLKLIGKREVDFLLVLIKLFSLGVTAEALRANICSKSAISLQRWPVDQRCTIFDPTHGSGRVGSENLEGCAGRVGSGRVKMV